jgi:Trypsin-like peptidase domain/IPT/TIG domain
VQRLKQSLPEHLAMALVGGLVLASLVALVPAVANRLAPATPVGTPAPTTEPTAPPAAVLLPEETDRDLQGVMILVNDATFGTTFQIDPHGGFLTAASLVSGSRQLRLVDNTGGSHAVRVVGLDPVLGLAEIRADVVGLPIAFGVSGSVKPGDPLVLLASPKVMNLRTATPTVVTAATAATFGIRADDLPGEVGGPLVGPGGTVLGLFTGHGAGLPIAAAQSDLLAWRGQAGTLMPLASLPADLVLRGTDQTSTPVSGPSVQSIAPTRASTSQTTLVTLQGSGFSGGASLSVRFVPVASPTGAFQGVAPTVVSSSVITVKVPAGAAIQDYVVEFINGDGAIASLHTAFTVTP